MKKHTRASDWMYLFGSGKDILPEKNNLLPTYEDMIRCYQSVRLFLKGEGSKQAEAREVANIVAKKIEDVWERASLPVVSHKRIVDMILQYNKKFQTIIKPIKNRDTQFLTKKLQAFKDDAKVLFDICSCKCLNKEACICEKSKKIATIEWAFIEDQRSSRKMAIGKVDKAITAQLSKRIDRQVMEAQRAFNCNTTKHLNEPVAGPSGVNNAKVDVADSMCIIDNDDSTNDSEDSDFMWTYSLEKRAKISTKIPQMRLSLTNTAKAADLTGTSSRTVAKIVNAVLEDVNIISKEDAAKVVDKNKIRREVSKNRCQLQVVNRSQNIPIKGLYFDGRKDKTICQDKNRRGVKVEEHIALVEEPGGLYFGHVSLNQSRAKDIATSIMNYMNIHSIDLTKLTIIGCDGTNVNTGWKGGVIRIIEAQLNKPLQWSICLLHFNELPLRHILQNLDGGTKGPTLYSGPIGSLLTSCEKMPAVKFKVIKTTLPNVDEDELSTDQQYLYKICQAIGTGNCPKNLEERNPGKMAHSRWLTTANRLLRLYVATKDPSKNLQIIVEFVVKVYSRMWFEIKTNPYLEYGARHLFTTISVSRKLPKILQPIIKKVIQDNGYFAHPENILIAMLTDTRNHIRELAVKRILQSRQNDVPHRIFRIPKINFNAEDYIDLIDWSACVVTEPPLTLNMSEKQLLDIVMKNEIPKFEKFPCHTQTVERCVKLITDASSKVCGENARDGYIRAKIDARKNLPKFENKAQYFAEKL